MFICRNVKSPKRASVVQKNSSIQTYVNCHNVFRVSLGLVYIEMDACTKLDGSLDLRLTTYNTEYICSMIGMLSTREIW